MSLLNWPKNYKLIKIKKQQPNQVVNISKDLFLITPCWTTDSGKRFRRSSNISAFSKVLKHCSVAFNSISRCTRPVSVSKSPEDSKRLAYNKKTRNVTLFGDVCSVFVQINHMTKVCSVRHHNLGFKQCESVLPCLWSKTRKTRQPREYKVLIANFIF